jgi:hypothetical protein
MVQENIIIHGARQHNLKNIDVTIPRDKGWRSFRFWVTNYICDD